MRSTRTSPEISVVVPVLNEEEILPELLRRLAAALPAISDDYQIVIVDDGSRDETLNLLRASAAREPRLTVVSLSRNFGHQVAVSAGLAHATGRVVAIIDGDLQDPPETLPALHRKLGEGHDIVYGVRRKRKEGVLKRTAYWGFYRLLARLSDIPIPLDSGDFCMMSRRVVDILNGMPERDRFLRGLRAWVGLRSVGFEYERDARYGGKPKFTPTRLVRLALDGLLTHSDKPLRLASVTGCVIAASSLAFGIYALVWRLLTNDGLSGYASIACGIFFLGGIQLLALGVLGEYVGRVFTQVKGRPLFIVQEAHNVAALATRDVPSAASLEQRAAV